MTYQNNRKGTIYRLVEQGQPEPSFTELSKLKGKPILSYTKINEFIIPYNKLKGLNVYRCRKSNKIDNYYFECDPLSFDRIVNRYKFTKSGKLQPIKIEKNARITDIYSC